MNSDRGSMDRCLGRCILLLILMLAAGGPAVAQQDTVYMSVLNSRRHAWGRSDNPTIGLFVSTDAGRTWHHRGWREYIRMFFTTAGPDGSLWSACGNGILCSVDQGATWKITTGWEITEVLKVAIDPRHPSTVAAATAYGPVLSTDAGATWRYLRNGLPRPFVSDICIDRTTGSLLVPTELGIFRTDGVDSLWQPTSLRGIDTRTVVQHPGNPGIFWAGTEDEGVWMSADGGKTWTAKNNGLDHRTVYAIAFGYSPAPVIFVGTHGGGVYRSSDNGTTWRQVGAGLTNLDIHTIVALRSRPRTILAGSLNGGLFESTDNGETWRFNSQEDSQVWGLSVQ